MSIVNVNMITPRTVHLYGGNELGVLSLAAWGDAHPRVRHLGGDLFAGLDDQGAATTEWEASRWIPGFPEVLEKAAQQAAGSLHTSDGMIRINDEAQAVAALLDPTLLPTEGLHGFPIVFALARNNVLVIGADDEAATAMVLDAAEDLFCNGTPLVSAHPLALADNGWDRFDWSAAHPALDGRIRRVLRTFEVSAYEQQTRALSAEKEVHVAEPELHVRDDGVTVTFAAWPKGTATLLPVVDTVMVDDPSGTSVAVTMDEFLVAAGDRITRTGLTPARYFVPRGISVESSS